MSITKIMLLLGFALVAAGVSRGKEWHGIVPLHSTRADVERLLGPSKQPAKEYVSTHETENEVVLVEYSTGEPCSGGVNRWQVARGTVLNISVAPRKHLRFVDLQLDVSKYKVTDGGHVPNYTYYTNAQEGMQVEVTQGLVMSISYFPGAKDEELRCPSAKEELPPFETYGRIALTRRNTILDNFAIQLQQEKDLKGYIVSYFGPSGNSKSSLRIARSARNYLIRKRRVDPKRVFALAGGRRDSLMVELYLTTHDWPASTNLSKF